MALSDSKKTSQYDLEKGDAKYTNSTDVFKWVFITEGYLAIDEDALDVGITNYTKVVSAGLYVQDTTIANTTWTKSGAISTLSGDSFSYGADGANPTTGKTVAIYNDTSTNKDVVCFIDMTNDGGVGTGADTTLGFNYNVNAAGIATTTTNS
jgi:hypothetical protein